MRVTDPILYELRGPMAKQSMAVTFNVHCNKNPQKKTKMRVWKDGEGKEVGWQCHYHYY